MSVLRVEIVKRVIVSVGDQKLDCSIEEARNLIPMLIKAIDIYTSVKLAEETHKAATEIIKIPTLRPDDYQKVTLINDG